MPPFVQTVWTQDRWKAIHPSDEKAKISPGDATLVVLTLQGTVIPMTWIRESRSVSMCLVDLSVVLELLSYGTVQVSDARRGRWHSRWEKIRQITKRN